ncbi:hypothetical protein SAMN05720470_1081, partial [Fibrobacter sp. UWOV1]
SYSATLFITCFVFIGTTPAFLSSVNFFQYKTCSMKRTIGKVYAIILMVLENRLTAEEAIEMIRKTIA